MREHEAHADEEFGCDRYGLGSGTSRDLGTDRQLTEVDL